MLLSSHFLEIFNSKGVKIPKIVSKWCKLSQKAKMYIIIPFENWLYHRVRSKLFIWACKNNSKNWYTSPTIFSLPYSLYCLSSSRNILEQHIQVLLYSSIYFTTFFKQCQMALNVLGWRRFCGCDKGNRRFPATAKMWWSKIAQRA